MTAMTPDVEKLIAILSRKPVMEQMDILHKIANDVLENLQRYLKAKGADKATMEDIEWQISHLYRYHIFWLMERIPQVTGDVLPEKDESWEEL